MKETIKGSIERLLSKEFYCNIATLSKKGTIYTLNFDARQPYIKILAYRNCVVVCTSKDLSVKIQNLLRDKNRDEIFELPYVYGQTIHYVPGDNYSDRILALPDYKCEFLVEQDVYALKGLTGFENSLSFDQNGTTPTRAVCVARDGGKIIGIAGAAATSADGVWEMGVDVMEEYRNARLGTYLVSRLTKELLERKIVPFYSASVTNIGSQMVANRSGYMPLWVDTFGTTLDGSSVYHDIVSSMSV